MLNKNHTKQISKPSHDSSDRLEIVCQTDVGAVRRHNEDCIDSEAQLGIAVLADGVGGMKSGEVASSLSVQSIMNELRCYCQGTVLFAETLDTQEQNLSIQARAVKQAIETANRAVFNISQTELQHQGMGTTVVVSLFYKDKVVVGHVGDSRLYRFRCGQLQQLTKDHSLVQELIDKGLYTKEEARLSDQKNIITRALGAVSQVEVELREYQVKAGDLYLMCSDGLTDCVADKEIAMGIRKFSNQLEIMIRYLINVANISGGWDNISVIIARVTE